MTHPPHAVLCWVDSGSVFVELPTTSGESHRLSFPLTEQGFSRALNILKARPRPLAPIPPAREASPSRFTADQRKAASKVLRSLAMA